jgi:hypothetical protein
MSFHVLLLAKEVLVGPGCCILKINLVLYCLLKPEFVQLRCLLQEQLFVVRSLALSHLSIKLVQSQSFFFAVETVLPGHLRSSRRWQSRALPVKPVSAS